MPEAVHAYEIDSDGRGPNVWELYTETHHLYIMTVTDIDAVADPVIRHTVADYYAAQEQE